VRVLKAASLYFALVFGTGFLLGMIRVPFLVPRLGIRSAELIEMPLMLVAIVLAARFVVRVFSLPSDGFERIRVGFLALALVAAAELSFAYLFQGLSPSQYFASRDAVSGLVYLAVLVLFALMPVVVSR